MIQTVEEAKEIFISKAAESANLTPQQVEDLLKQIGIKKFDPTKMSEYKTKLLEIPLFKEGFDRKKLINKFSKKEPIRENCPIPDCGGMKIRKHKTNVSADTWECSRNKHHYIAWKTANLRAICEGVEDPETINQFMITIANHLERKKENAEKE